MFAAKAAALRTLDLSRQVGAAIFSQQGDVIAMGSNEVPSGLGGTYWADGDEDIDDRDYRREHDANDRRKSQLLNELLQLASVSNIQDLLQRAEIKESQFMDALEYGRIIHAEMSAICDAALRKILLILADRSRCGQQPIPRQTYWSSALRPERTSPANQIRWWRGGGHLLKRRVLAELGHSQIQIEPLCNEAAPRPFRILNPAC